MPDEFITATDLSQLSVFARVRRRGVGRKGFTLAEVQARLETEHAKQLAADIESGKDGRTIDRIGALAG
jgi:hypothetical protein